MAINHASVVSISAALLLSSLVIARKLSAIEQELRTLRRDVDAVRPGNRIQISTLVDIEGDLHSISQKYEHSKVILVFTSAECPACTEHMKSLALAMESAGSELHSIFVVCRGTLEQVIHWSESVGARDRVPFIAVNQVDVDAICKLRVLPTTLTVGSLGRVDDVMEGPFGTSAWREVVAKPTSTHVQNRGSVLA